MLNYRCSCKSISQITLSCFLRGDRCSECRPMRQSKKHKIDPDYVDNYFEERGCHLLSPYVYANKRLPYVCSCGEKSTTYFYDFKKGKRCRLCELEKRTGRTRVQIQEDKRFRKLCYYILRRTRLLFGKPKSARTHELLGYTPEQLKIHITQHPNWAIVKDGKWSIDHIHPIEAFIDYDVRDLKLINCLENLQPLSFEDNCRKGDSYYKEEFENWLNSKGITL